MWTSGVNFNPNPNHVPMKHRDQGGTNRLGQLHLPQPGTRPSMFGPHREDGVFIVQLVKYQPYSAEKAARVDLHVWLEFHRSNGLSLGAVCHQ